MNIDRVEKLAPIAAEPNAPVPMNLVTHVTAMLTTAGVSNPESWQKNLKSEAMTTTDLNIQRFLINRCWVGIFSTLKTTDELIQTRNARGCLMNGECSLEDWIRLFETQVIPCAIKMNLLTIK